MNIFQNPDDVAVNYSRFSSIQVPGSMLLSAIFHALAWGTIIFRDRNLAQRIDGLEPRLAIVEQEHRDFLESGNIGYEEETHIEWNDGGTLKCVKRSGSADEIQKVEKFNPKSYTRTTASSRCPRRSARLQARGDV